MIRRKDIIKVLFIGVCICHVCPAHPCGSNPMRFLNSFAQSNGKFLGLLFAITTGSDVKEHFSCSTELSMKFQLLIKTKMLQKRVLLLNPQILYLAC